MYSSVDTASGALAGAAVGAIVGAVCLAAATTVAPTSFYTASAIRPAVSSVTIPVNAQASVAQSRFAGATMATLRAGNQNEEVVVQTQGTAVYGWAFALFATVAGAANGLFLMNSRRAAMAATTGRREALFAGVAAAGLAAGPAFAAYGEGANVFGKPKDVEQTFTATGEGWSVVIPGKYNNSKERDFPGVVARWEDNFDAVNNTWVSVNPLGKNSVTEIGDLDAVRNQVVTPLLGAQAYDGPSISEGGFAPGRYSSAAILGQKEVTKNGKVYYIYELLTRTADGNEGGRHQLFSVTASNGKLYVFKSQAGDKRWFKGLERPLRSSVDSFTVA